ncbi:MAG: hypothetical protein KDA92_18225, partial [Planctomycetales bacterium]|nr:hypothetical protein [Planctomycetales bacterium]
RISHYQQLGVPPERILGLLADWCGTGARTECTLTELLQRFDLQRIPRDPIVFAAEDDAWLRGA